ncbi:hypothetical protein AAFC00_003783 [Neodothiora populina]|uniref:Uncharacterized protein n=1 Tax=Neodothiora populina TaxID=2781224 RepID=A0ABR3PFG7_9PEZI
MSSSQSPIRPLAFATPQLPYPRRRTFATSLNPLQKVSGNYNRPPVRKSRATGSRLPVYSLIFIFVAGTAAFNILARSRQGQGQSHYVLPTRDTQENRDDWLKKSS